MRSRGRAAKPEQSSKVGDTIDLEGPSNLVRLPDGSVVTARTTYRFAHVGEHVVINAASNDETVVDVAPAEK